MYRGFIHEIGTLEAATAGRLAVHAPKCAGEVAPGGSFSVNGACVSAESVEDGVLSATLSEETRRRTTLGDLSRGARVNVEVPVRAGQALEGHLVQGHVDAIGKVMRVDEEGPGRHVWIRPPERFLEEIAPKGSVAVDGVSLTVAEISRDRFAVALVPSTLERTTFAALAPGARVNLESDLFGRIAREHAGASGRALSRVIARLPWAGIVEGRLGVEKVVSQIAAGGSVLVWDPDREGEGDLITAGADMRPETWTFILTRICGHATVPCSRALLERLEIPPMPGAGDRHGTAMHVSVDWVGNTGTGVAPVERAATVRRLAHPDARPEDFLRPGHVFPLSARPGGLRERAGHTEATVALCRAAGLPPVGICCEVMHPDGHMARLAELERLALHEGLPLVSMGDLATHL
jgi:3,4-dihydroxy 2-butanone 4-phosphate synthase/3,4-dihydroxy 2-butanone 4-phosphate synthase/GTP cyclohydrolase II